LGGLRIRKIRLKSKYWSHGGTARSLVRNVPAVFPPGPIRAVIRSGWIYAVRTNQIEGPRHGQADTHTDTPHTEDDYGKLKQRRVRRGSPPFFNLGLVSIKYIILFGYTVLFIENKYLILESKWFHKRF
jgi:hypothetical protein